MQVHWYPGMHDRCQAKFEYVHPCDELYELVLQVSENIVLKTLCIYIYIHMYTRYFQTYVFIYIIHAHMYIHFSFYDLYVFICTYTYIHLNHVYMVYMYMHTHSTYTLFTNIICMLHYDIYIYMYIV